MSVDFERATPPTAELQIPVEDLAGIEQPPARRRRGFKRRTKQPSDSSTEKNQPKPVKEKPAAQEQTDASKPKKKKADKKAKKGDLGYDENGVPLKKAAVFVLYKGKKSKPELIARSLRALTMVLRVGESEARALEIVGEQYHKYEIGRAYEHAAKTMREDGAGFKQALMAEEVLPRTVRELIEASHTSTALQKNLQVAATLLGESQNVKKELLMNLIQPGFMMAMCIGLLFTAVTVIIPGFISTFASLGAETPPMTLVILQVAEVTKWALGGVIVAVILFMCYWVTLGRKSERFKIMMDTVSIRIFGIGPIVQLAATSRLFQLLSANLDTGIGEPQSLKSAANGCGNEALKHHCITHAEKMLNDGLPLKDFIKTKLVPSDARNLLGSAPSIRQEIEIMNELAPEYRNEANVQLKTLSKTLDPIINYMVYGVAGLLIVAIVLPMYAIYPALMKLGGG
ncbi:type II secretion system protein (plasmid) [Pseudarthrobacter chlorophenolicus A6]|uniref:Type II secretion system protein n=1 Tax=Pseudarthrobacter chlorophenolicus (strain ATCC 700700 / DSM 12829 / CIP 107037 / JCM 12360 / KCTC 9906 / NCIMB 13794 / A6) TaxID=452863 RepID=B8HI51_PSECP|nr:type II secretion system F family protein [Pseudarthrobacter chlorophenolicus]ACL42098.1 type II secretion system protein [Pseudarthrobacter chlorophenolicus A6]SDQ13404.1 type IV pilus assembly protein PilC [Pseudarthrobacter chlorophenolicus]